jgi:hypothetical protein
MGHVHVSGGPPCALSQKLLNEVAGAGVFAHAYEESEYDAWLA